MRKFCFFLIAFFVGVMGSWLYTRDVSTNHLKERGTCAYLIHGLSASKASLQFIGKRLEDAGVRVFYADYQSRGTLHISFGNVHYQYLAMLAQGCEPRRTIVIGHSLGGLIAALLSSNLAAPDRPGFVVLVAATIYPDEGDTFVSMPLGTLVRDDNQYFTNVVMEWRTQHHTVKESKVLSLASQTTGRVLVVGGDVDNHEPLAVAESFASAMHTKSWVVPGMHHIPSHAEWSLIADHIVQWSGRVNH